MEFEEQNEDVSPPSIAKIPKSYMPSVAIPTISVPEIPKSESSSLAEAEKKNEKFEEDNQQNIGASSIPRPRAVVSSPNNDVVIGNKNRVKTERPSVLKNRKTIQNRHALRKVIPSRTAENSMNMKKSKEVPDESNLKGKKASAVTVPSQRRNPRTGKPSSIRI
ncbi:hypothetical protein FEM48_Zijuj07G0091600 [Ziziphus jujuba var. spinosa]|uniref:Uncharacterized protein n=1 Tax=Ziziphus jujuba var. spinosa TaxID=714518 RepID=A0A978V3R8_ZIZJJ|nr:hypothetical protein FEM48_Zijuj07G0091600 [Ziziphus jujuba var. spinosa]